MRDFFVRHDGTIVRRQRVSLGCIHLSQELMYRLCYRGTILQKSSARSTVVVSQFYLNERDGLIHVCLHSVFNQASGSKVISAEEFELQVMDYKERWVPVTDYALEELLWVRRRIPRNNTWSTTSHRVKVNLDENHGIRSRIVTQTRDPFVEKCTTFEKGPHAYQLRNSLIAEQEEKHYDNREVPEVINAFLHGNRLITTYYDRLFASDGGEFKVMTDFLPMQLITESKLFDKFGRLRVKYVPQLRVDYVGGRPTVQYSSIFQTNACA